MKVALSSLLLLFCTPVYADSCWSSSTRLDYWCAAEAYDAKKMYLVAATMRCGIPEIRKQFDTRDECVTANTYTSPLPPPPQEKEDECCTAEEHEEVEVEVHSDLSERLETVARKQHAYEEAEQNRKMYAQQALTELKELE